jgi:hypothetical protein
MKKLVRILVACVLMAAMLCGTMAMAQGPYPKDAFNNVWIANAGNSRIDAYPEDDGWILEIWQLTDLDNLTGFFWEVKALYNEDKDQLDAVSVTKWNAHIDEDGEIVEDDNGIIYEDMLENTSTFVIGDNNKLTWNDSKEDAGKGLEFEAIGRFEGVWPGVGCNAEILWADDHYTVYVDVVNEEGKTESYDYNGSYNYGTDTLEVYGVCDVITYENNQEVSRVEGTENVTGTLYINENHDLVWENDAEQGVKTYTFQNQYNASEDESSNG